MEKHVIEAVGDGIDIEDGGRAAIVHVAPDDGDDGWFIKLQSWNSYVPGKQAVVDDPRQWHPIVAAAEGRRVRVTVEFLDE